MKERFDVTGMTCSACSSHVEKSVGKLTGVENVSVNLLTNSMQVEFDENKLNTAMTAGPCWRARLRRTDIQWVRTGLGSIKIFIHKMLKNGYPYIIERLI